MSSKELYIGNLDPSTKSQEIKEIFERYGSINRCEVKFGVSAHNVAFGFIAFDSNKDAERAQRKEHGRSLRGRRLIVEFTKTTPGQNGRRGRFTGDTMTNGNSNTRDRSRSRDRDSSRSRHRRRRRSPSYSRKSSKDRSSSSDRRRKRDRSPSSSDHKSGSKRNRSSSNDDQHRASDSHKNGNSKKR